MHTFRLINAEGRSTFVKFHWKPKLVLLHPQRPVARMLGPAGRG